MLTLDLIWQPDNQQAQFRTLLNAMSRPGRLYPAGDISGTGAIMLGVLATLLDGEVSLADPYDLLLDEDWLMLQTRLASPESADYILCDASRPPTFIPKLGTLPSPEQSATLFLIVSELGGHGIQLKLTGPGIAISQDLIISGLDTDWLMEREDWNSAFPLGVDIILLDGMRLTALPRTTRVEVV